MATYLIDLENVHFSGIKYVTNHPNDTFYLFYSEKSNTIPILLHEKLKKLSNYRFIHVNTNGKDALDFQLSTYLGYLIAYKPKETFYIISNDKGFSNVTDFWTNLNFKVSLISNLEPYSYVEDETVLTILNTYKKKQEVHNALIKTFGMEKGSEIYNQIKSQIKEN